MDILKANKNPQFSWYPKWVKMDEEHGLTPKEDTDAFKGPPQTKVSFPISARKQDASVYVTIDNGHYGPELALMYTFKEFNERVLTRFTKEQREEPDFAKKKFELFPMMLADKGKRYWDSIVHKIADADKDDDHFNEAFKDYLEKLVGFPNIGDQVIRQLRVQKKPAMMPYDEFVNRRDQLMDYIKDGWLRCTLAMPTAQEQADQIFLHQPTPHQDKYAENNKTVSTDTDELRTFFEGQHMLDVSSGHYKQLCAKLKQQAIARKKKEKAALEEESSTKRQPTSRKNDRRAPRRDYDRDYNRDRRYQPRDDRSGTRRGHEWGRDRRGGRDDRRDDRRDRAQGRGGYSGSSYRRSDDRRHEDRRSNNDRGGRDRSSRNSGSRNEPHAMHVDEEASRRSRSRSRSPERDRSPSPARARARSHSHDSYDSRSRAEEENLMVYATDAAAAAKKKGDDDTVYSSSSSERVYDEKKRQKNKPFPRVEFEKKRAPIKFENGEYLGLGSFYQRAP